MVGNAALCTTDAFWLVVETEQTAHYLRIICTESNEPPLSVNRIMPTQLLS